MANAQKLEYLLQYLVIKQKMCKQNCENCKNYTFLKSPEHGEFKCAKTFVKCVFQKNFPKSYKMLKSNDWK